MKLTGTKFQKEVLQVQIVRGKISIHRFKYLRTNIYRKPDLKREIKRRLMQGNRKIY